MSRLVFLILFVFNSYAAHLFLEQDSDISDLNTSDFIKTNGYKLTIDTDINSSPKHIIISPRSNVVEQMPASLVFGSVTDLSKLTLSVFSMPSTLPNLVGVNKDQLPTLIDNYINGATEVSSEITINKYFPRPNSSSAGTRTFANDFSANYIDALADNVSLEFKRDLTVDNQINGISDLILSPDGSGKTATLNGKYYELDSITFNNNLTGAKLDLQGDRLRARTISFTSYGTSFNANGNTWDLGFPTTESEVAKIEINGDSVLELGEISGAGIISLESTSDDDDMPSKYQRFFEQLHFKEGNIILKQHADFSSEPSILIQNLRNAACGFENNTASIDEDIYTNLVKPDNYYGFYINKDSADNLSVTLAADLMLKNTKAGIESGTLDLDRHTLTISTDVEGIEAINIANHPDNLVLENTAGVFKSNGGTFIGTYYEDNDGSSTGYFKLGTDSKMYFSGNDNKTLPSIEGVGASTSVELGSSSNKNYDVGSQTTTIYQRRTQGFTAQLKDDNSIVNISNLTVHPNTTLKLMNGATIKNIDSLDVQGTLEIDTDYSFHEAINIDGTLQVNAGKKINLLSASSINALTNNGTLNIIANSSINALTNDGTVNSYAILSSSNFTNNGDFNIYATETALPTSGRGTTFIHNYYKLDAEDLSSKPNLTVSGQLELAKSLTVTNFTLNTGGKLTFAIDLTAGAYPDLAIDGTSSFDGIIGFKLANTSALKLNTASNSLRLFPGLSPSLNIEPYEVLDFTPQAVGTYSITRTKSFSDLFADDLVFQRSVRDLVVMLDQGVSEQVTGNKLSDLIDNLSMMPSSSAIKDELKSIIPIENQSTISMQQKASTIGLDIIQNRVKTLSNWRTLGYNSGDEKTNSNYWIMGLAQYGNGKLNTNSSFDIKNLAMGVGIDRELSEHQSLGIAMVNSNSRTNYIDFSKTNQLSILQTSIYYAYEVEHLYADLVTSGSYNKHVNANTNSINKFSSSSYAQYIKLGARTKVTAPTTIGLYVKTRYNHTVIPEHSQEDLNFLSHSSNLLQWGAGLTFEYRSIASMSKIYPSFEIGYLKERNLRKQPQKFQFLGYESMLNLTELNLDPELVEANFSFDWLVADYTSLNFKLMYEYRKHYQQFGGLVNIKYKF